MDFQELNEKDAYYITVNLEGDSPQTAGNYGRFFVARYPIEVLRVTKIQETKASNAGAVTLDVKKVPDATAISGGVSILATPFNLKSADNTVVIKEGVNLNGNRILKEKESLALVSTGTLTDLTGVQVTVYFKFANRGSYR